jgi:cyclophilin family peptidyl-prolyl cis-trans isomerase/HEAT repeat protein
MKKSGIAGLVLAALFMIFGIYYFDVFKLRGGKDNALASIIEYEDIRRVSDNLISYLHDPDPEIRARAALAVGRIGDIKGAENLFDLINDSTIEVSCNASFGLGLTGEKSFASRLMEEAVDLEPIRLASAVNAVGRLADSTMTGTVDELIGYLNHPDHQVREAACNALWRAGIKRAGSALTEIGHNDPVRKVKIAALYALVRLGIKDPVGLYSGWIADADPFVRSLAYRGLSLPKDDQWTTMVAVGLNDRDNNVVSSSISALTGIGTVKAMEFLAARYENETDEKLKIQLLGSFTLLKNETIAEQVNLDIDSSASAGIKAAGIVYLAKIRGSETMALIDSLLRLNDRTVNVGVAQALGSIGGEYVKPRLNALFKDSIPEVRSAAFDALCTIDQVNVDYYLNTALADQDYVVVAQGVDKIGQLKSRQYLEQLMGMIKMPDEMETDVKRSIIAAAAEFLDSTDVDSLAEDIVYHGLLDKDYLVSREASEIYENKLGIDKSSFVTKPEGLASRNEIKKFITRFAKNPRAIVSTEKGDYEIELDYKRAPLAVYNFIKLAQKQFYDGLIFHRVVPAFVVQGGDPRGDGSGGPGYSIRCEYSDIPFERGTVGMATSGKDSGGSQFFVMLARVPHLDGRYTLFGKVVAGMETVDQIVKGDRIKSVRIIEESKR